MATRIAIDLGASNGRVIAAQKTGDSYRMQVVHRFATPKVTNNGHLCWDFDAIMREIKQGLKEAAKEYDDIQSIGVDTWGVDYGFINPSGELVANPMCYRDSHIKDLRKPSAQWYQFTGIQQLDINTLPRLYAFGFPQEGRLLFMPDLINYHLCGVACTEPSIASTSEMLDPRTGQWLDNDRIPDTLLPEIRPSGVVIGTILTNIALETGLNPAVKVVSVGSHDTASAAYAAEGDYEAHGEAFLSCGTWSLLGVTLSEPITSEAARLGGFSNETGVDGKILFLQNITGLWILQQLIEGWKAKGLPYDYPTLLAAAAKAETDVIIDVDGPEFTAPEDMEQAILTAVNRTEISQGELTRIVLQSLAERYHKGIEELNKILPRPVKTLKVIGGGARNNLLMQLTAQATGIDVLPGEPEATALGNIMVQEKAN